MQRRIVSIFVFLVISTAAVSLFGQKVRLRAKITPVCGGASQSKFADIYADGNIAVQGGYSCPGAFIYDISNADAPVLASWYNPGNNLQFLEAIVIGNRGYFGTGNGGGVHIVDLSDPYNPFLLGTVDAAHGSAFIGIHEMVVFDQNSRRYLIENYNGFATKIIKIIDVTDPANPFLVRDLNPTEPIWVHGLHVRGNRLFTSGWGNSTNRGRTEIYGIANLATQPPVLLGVVEDTSGITAGNSMHSSWSSEDGNFLYSARETINGTGDVRVYNITNPALPVLVNSISTQSLGLNAVTPHNPVVAGNYLYVSWYQAGIQVFDISDRANPVRVGQYDMFPNAFAPTPDEKKAMLEADPWDMVCGSAFVQNVLPTTYDGTWAVFPMLGRDKVLAGDLAGGLFIFDTTGVSAPARNQVSDFDGDRKTDLAFFSSDTGSWTIRASGGTSDKNLNWGITGDVMVPGDYDGDGRADTAVWRPSDGYWYVWRSTGEFYSRQFGVSGDIPVPADFDADGRTDIAVWRPSNGTWYVVQSTLGYKVQPWGVNGDKPVTGDFEGDGKVDLGVWRPSNGTWYSIDSSSNLLRSVAWGQGGDHPLTGDFSGDGKSDLAVFRPSDNTWYIYDPAAAAITTRIFGEAGDIPVPADYDGDGKTDISVYRPADQTWYRLDSGNNGFTVIGYGAANGDPTPASVQPK